MAVESSTSWCSLSPSLSPGAAWFVLFSVIVGAVAVMSRARQEPLPSSSSSTTRRLTRSASSMVLERLRSFSVFSVLHPISGVQEDITTDPPRSQTMLSAAAAADEHAAASTSGCGEAEEKNPISLDEAHPVAAVRPSPQAAGAANAADVAATAPVERTSKRKEAAKAAVAVKRRGRAFADEAEGKAEVNARAERFIRQFREDLRLQRLVSVLNRTHTLGGGGGGASPAP